MRNAAARRRPEDKQLAHHRQSHFHHRKNKMIEIIANPILGCMVVTFSIGMAFTIWSAVSDWMWDRKNK